MSDNKEEAQVQPAPSKEDKLDKLIEAIGALTTHLTAKKEEPQVIPAKVEPVHEAVRFYEERDATNVYQTRKPKTIGELTKEAQESMVHDRNEFFSHVLYKHPLTTSYKFQRNKVYYDEYAFINIYENSSDTFKEMYKSMYDKLMKCDYRGILNEYIMTQKQMDRFLTDDKERYHEYNKQSMELNSLALNLVYNRSLLG